MYSCPACGQLTEMNNNVCEHCGTLVKICPECKTAVASNLDFCDFCGLLLEDVKPAPSAITVPAAVEAAPAESTSIIAAPAASETVAITPTKPKKAEPAAVKMDQLRDKEKAMVYFVENTIRPFSKARRFFNNLCAWLVVVPLVLFLTLLVLSFTKNFQGKFPFLPLMIPVMLISFIVLFLISRVFAFLEIFALVLTSSKIVRHAKKIDFDYVNFYGNSKILKAVRGVGIIESENGEDGNLSLSFSPGSVQLIQAFLYKKRGFTVFIKIIFALLDVWRKPVIKLFTWALTLSILIAIVGIFFFPAFGALVYTLPSLAVAGLNWLLITIINKILNAINNKIGVKWIYSLKKRVQRQAEN